MRHQLGWADLAARRVGLFGLGVEGRSALARLEGLADEVVLVDDSPSGEVDGREVLATAAGGLSALEACEVVIKTPGISAYRPEVEALEAAGVAVVGGVGLELHGRDAARVVCVTGTKGKSTTASLLGALAGAAGLDAMVTGNLGLPPFDPSVPEQLDLLVVETSSFQALDVADAPGIVVVTSLDVDHIDWHGSVERYHADKLSLTSLEGAGTTVVPAFDPGLSARRELLGGRLVEVGAPSSGWAAASGLAGAHNHMNAELAAEVLRQLGVEMAGDDDALREAAASWSGLPGRFVEIARQGSLRFVDDSLATNVLPTLAALDALDGERVAILVGGHDRGIDYSGLVERLASRPEGTLVLGLPENGPRITAAIATAGGTTELLDVADVAEGVRQAVRWSGGEGVVLLSPAAPSFSQFTSWKERSAAFAAAVEEAVGGAGRARGAWSGT